MATRKSTSTRRLSTSNAAPEVALAAPRITAAERRSMAQELARWRAESDLRTLRQAEEIRRDAARLQRAARVAAEEMKALQAISTITRTR
ncbi:MAG: hypothetical protein WBN89_10690 [Prochlorococcaceae cyanobacterium]